MTDIARLTTALVDRYLIERELGAGGMATVYLAHDVRHDRKVALKVLRPELAAILGGERFLAEIKTTANLQHPHILSLFDSGEADGQVYYVMPYVEGESVRDRLMRERQLPVDDAIRITREVADALEYAHGHGIVHRDIKPENILLHGGHAMVADFGIALAASRSDGGTRMTETGMSLGTPHYMAPEQAMGEREITPKADVYALGCVLYEMLAGEPPFTGPTAQAIIARVMTEQPRSLAIQRHTIPPQLEAVVVRALEKLPADRFASAAAFGEALANPAGFAVSTAATGLRTAAAPYTHRDWRHRIALPALGAAVAMAALAGWALLRPSPPAPTSRYALDLALGGRMLAGGRGGVAVAPDGSRFLYVGPSESGQYIPQVWVKERDDDRPHGLPATVGAVSATFSPDGQSVAYTISGRILRAQVSGGAGILFADSASSSAAPAWMDDGSLVFVGQGSRGLRRLPAGGGVAAWVWPADSGTVRAVSALPGGRAVLFTRCLNSGCGTGAEVWGLDLRSGAARVVAPGARKAWYLPTGHVLFVRADGAALAIPFDLGTLAPRGAAVSVLDSVMVDLAGQVLLDVSRTGTLVMLRFAPDQVARNELVWVDRAGRATPVEMNGPVQLTGNGNAGLSLSPDGRRLAISLTGPGGDAIWVKELPSGPLSRVTFDSVAAAFRPRWMPDGRSLLFVAGGSDLNSLVLSRVAADGTSPPSVVARHASILMEGAVSPDGRWVVARTAGGIGRQGRDIIGYRVGDTTAVPLVANPAYDESAFTISPDGRWIAYESDETGSREVFVRPFPDTDAGRWQASTAGGMAPLWARNGRELFFVDAQRRMASVRVAGGATPGFGERSVLFNLTPDDYLDENTYYTPFDIAPDGRFLMARARSEGEAAHAAVIVAEHWFTELRRRLAGSP